MRIPSTPVIRPPKRKLIAFGQRFEKSYEGLTTFAAMLTESVATARVKSARTITIGLENLAVSAMGSQIAEPYTVTVADVINTASNGKTVMVVGRPSSWPTAWARWLFPNRVKSGMFSESVDQKAICAISEGKNSFQNAAPHPTLPGCDTIGPRPPALLTIQTRRNSATRMTNGAAQFSNRRTALMPRVMITMLRAQKMAKLSHNVQCWPATIEELIHPLPKSAPARV